MADPILAKAVLEMFVDAILFRKIGKIGDVLCRDSLNTLITPGPDTSCNITLSTVANITSPGDNFCLPDARASIFSVIVIPTKTIHAIYLRFCLYDGLKPLESANIKHKR
jgi:hypothetical protein